MSNKVNPITYVIKDIKIPKLRKKNKYLVSYKYDEGLFVRSNETGEKKHMNLKNIKKNRI